MAAKPFIPENSQNFDPHEYQGTISDLTPGQKYTFQIQAKTKIKGQKMPILAPPVQAGQQAAAADDLRLAVPPLQELRGPGHLLLSHIIAKFAIHKRIVLQVFHSLLKAHAVEARGVVRQVTDRFNHDFKKYNFEINSRIRRWRF